MTTAEPLRVIGYVRVSTEEQTKSGAGLEAQRAAIEAEAERRGWQLLRIAEDAGASAKTLARRPGLADALADLDAGAADALVVGKLDRLSRSLVDFGHLLDRSRRRGWELVALDLGVDTTTPSGQLVANVMMAVAQWERQVIGQRTRDALAVKRAQGVRMGRPSTMPPDVAERVRRRHAEGASLKRIAAELNAEGVPTPRGGSEWRPSSLRAVVRREVTAA